VVLEKEKFSLLWWNGSGGAEKKAIGMQDKKLKSLALIIPEKQFMSSDYGTIFSAV
jgi:hypothetical protein